MQSKAVEALDEVDSVNEFLDKFKSLDPNEALENALETSNLDDLEKLDKLEDLAAQYKEFMDNNLSTVADAIEEKIFTKWDVNPMRLRFAIQRGGGNF